MGLVLLHTIPASTSVISNLFGRRVRLLPTQIGLKLPFRNREISRLRHCLFFFFIPASRPLATVINSNGPYYPF